MIADQEVDAAMAAARDVCRYIFGNAFTMNALDTPRKRSAVLGYYRFMIDEKLFGVLDNLADKAFRAGRIQPDTHCRRG
jgi:hypothetical protein